MEAESIELKPSDALLIVDVQSDFLPGGSLAVPRGNEVIAPINEMIRLFEERNMPIFASRDWHPPNHCSFREQGGPWPPHCIAQSAGAAFPRTLKLPARTRVVSKAMRPESDAYSCFEKTALTDQLKALGVRRLFVAGLATEYCVLNSVIDALQAGFHVLVLEDAIRAISQNEDDIKRARHAMVGRGAIWARSSQLR
ncbi:MAG: nicotinamidase [Oligoflexia bacterium]|nr:nicotinamidase [Oligoflexia bacterium]